MRVVDLCQLEYNPSTNQFLVGSWDGYVVLINQVGSKKMKFFWEKEKKVTPIRGVAFTPDGKYIFCNDFKLVFLETNFEEEICTIPATNKDTCK